VTTWAAGLVLWLGALPAISQQAPPSALPGVFGEVLDVRVVNLEVVVTDRDGIPILGLRPQDFELMVDDVPVPIDYFSEVRGGLAVEAGAGGVVAGVPELAPGEPVGTSYLLFIDDFFALAADRDRILEGIVEDLPLLRPEDRMAVVAFDGRNPEMLSSWSSEVATLERVLKRARERPALGLHRIAERRQFSVDQDLALRELLQSDIFGSRTVRTQLSPQERSWVQLVSEQLDRTMAAASATLRSFAKPPGRKVMILLSGGWPFLPTDFLLGDFSRVILDRGGLEGEDLYKRLIDTANLLGYTLYPVDVPGFDRNIVDTSIASTSEAAPLGRNMIRQQELHYTLSYLAEETGGKAFLNAARRDAFSGVASDTRSYYWLGFTPDRAWDDERHTVEVQVAQTGYRVRSREGYLDTSRSREVTMAVESALLFGNASSENVLGVSTGEPRKAGLRKMEVPLRVEIPLVHVTFLPVGEGYASQLELRIAVQDAKGRRAEIPVVPFTLRAQQPPTGGTTTFETGVLLRREPHDAVVAVYDTASGRILSAGLSIEP
jgi:VWFA-related protein